MLVNNAGIMAIPLSRIKQGWEMHFARQTTLVTFALATALRSALLRARGGPHRRRELRGPLLLSSNIR